MPLELVVLPIDSLPMLPKLSENVDEVVCSEKLRGHDAVPSAGRGTRSGEGEFREKVGCSWCCVVDAMIA